MTSKYKTGDEWLLLPFKVISEAFPQGHRQQKFMAGIQRIDQRDEISRISTIHSQFTAIQTTLSRIMSFVEYTFDSYDTSCIIEMLKQSHYLITSARDIFVLYANVQRA